MTDQFQIQSQILLQIKINLRDALRSHVKFDVYKCNYCGKVRIYLKSEEPSNLTCYCNGGLNAQTYAPNELIKYGQISGQMEKVAEVTSNMGQYLMEILEGYLKTVTINEDGELEVTPKGE